MLSRRLRADSEVSAAVAAINSSILDYPGLEH